MSGQVCRKAGAERAPSLLALRPGSISWTSTERRRQICPQRIAVEICPVERIPRRSHLMAMEGLARISHACGLREATSGMVRAKRVAVLV